MSTPEKPSNESRPVRDMSGYIARNDRRTNERQPAWRGKVLIKGKEYYLSLWERDNDFMSLSATDPDTLPPRPTPNQPAASPAPPASAQSGYPSAQAQPPVGGDPFGDIFST